MTKYDIITLLKNTEGSYIKIPFEYTTINFEVETVDNFSFEIENNIPVITCTLEGFDEENVGYSITIVINQLTGKLLDWFDIQND